MTKGSNVNMGNNVVHGVAAGAVTATSTDAVNGSQLYSLQNQMGTQDAQIGAVEHQVLNYKTKSYAGSAAAIAVGNLTQAMTPGKSMITAGAGTYQGQSALAVGVSHRFENNWTVKAAGTWAQAGGAGGAVSAGYEF